MKFIGDFDTVLHPVLSVYYCITEPVSFAGIAVPKLWLYILSNCVTQYVCIRGVFVLTTECPSLVVTLVVTLRKFVSLLFSIFYFQNPFTIQHWVGTILVFGGTALFTGIFNPILDLMSGTDRDHAASETKVKGVAVNLVAEEKSIKQD